MEHDFPIPELGKVAPYGVYVLNDNTGFVNLGTDHLPPGTSKWNKIEHRLFFYILKNWQGQPLVDIQTVVNLISNTTTAKGLKVKCQVDTNKYELKRKITDGEFAKIQLFPCDILGNWNYVIKPRKYVNQ